MKFKGEFTFNPSDFQGVCHMLALLTGSDPEAETQDTGGGRLMQVLPDAEYRFRQYEDGQQSVSVGKHLRPGDTIENDDGDYVVVMMAVRRA